MIKPQIQIVYRATDSITPYWNNPRQNDGAVEGLKRSIAEFDFLVPIVVDAEGVIVTGHTRHKASLELGLKEVPVIEAVHLSEEQIRAFRIADNRLSENAQWDENRLSDELRQIQAMGFDLGSTGFDKEELDCLTGLISAKCLDELDYATICGQVSAKAVAPKESVVISCGNYKFYVPVGVYKKWEADLLALYPKRDKLIAAIAERLGFSVLPADTPAPVAPLSETEQAQADQVAQLEGAINCTPEGITLGTEEGVGE